MKETRWYAGPRTAHDNVTVGPYPSLEAARADWPSAVPDSVFYSRTYEFCDGVMPPGSDPCPLPIERGGYCWVHAPKE